MRIRFSFFHKHTILGLTLLLSFSPNYASSEEHNQNSSAVFAGDCARNTAGRLELLAGLLRTQLTNDEQDKVDEGRKKGELKTGRMAAVCELMFGASVWDSLSPMLQSFSTRDRLKKLDTYKALMAADKITQQALVKDYLKTLFDMDAEGISAGMAQLAAQEKKREAEEKEAADKKVEKQAAIDDAFSVFDINAKDAAAKIKAAEEAAIIKDKKEAAKTKAAEDAAKIAQVAVKAVMSLQKQIEDGDIVLGNKITSITGEGITRTVNCNPACTLGSPEYHGNITGLDMGVPQLVYKELKKKLPKLKRSDIVAAALEGLKVTAKTSGDRNRIRAAAMPDHQIKLNKEMHKLSQAKTSDPKRLAPALNQQAPVVETEAPVGDPESAMVVGTNPP